MAEILRNIVQRKVGLTRNDTLESAKGYAVTPQVITSTATVVEPYGTTIIATTAAANTHVIGTPSLQDIGVFKNVSWRITSTSTAAVLATESTNIFFANASISTGQTITSTSTATGRPGVQLQYESSGIWHVIGGSSAMLVA